MKSLKGIRPLSHSHIPLSTCEWLAQANTIHQGPLDLMQCQAEGCGNWQRAKHAVELPHEIHWGSVHTSPGTCSNLSYVFTRLDLTLSFRHFIPEFQVKCGDCIHVILGEKFCLFFRGRSAYLQGSCYASGGNPLQFFLSSEKTAKETGTLPFNLCFQVAPDLTRLAEGGCETWSVYSFLSRGFSSVFFIIPTEVWEILHNKKIWQLHDSLDWVSSQDIMMAHQELSACIACTVCFRWWKTIWRLQSLKIVWVGEPHPEGTVKIEQQNCEHSMSLEVSDSDEKNARLDLHSTKSQFLEAQCVYQALHLEMPHDFSGNVQFPCLYPLLCRTLSKQSSAAAVQKGMIEGRWGQLNAEQNHLHAPG